MKKLLSLLRTICFGLLALTIASCSLFTTWSSNDISSGNNSTPSEDSSTPDSSDTSTPSEDSSTPDSSDTSTPSEDSSTPDSSDTSTPSEDSSTPDSSDTSTPSEDSSTPDSSDTSTPSEDSSTPDSSDTSTPSEDTKGLKFTLSEDGESYSVTGIGTATDTDIVIPSVYNDKPVTSIGSYAFEGCSSLESITIPNSVTSIGDYAFSNCSSLIIYCEATSKPSGWSSSWNSSRPVYWGITNQDIIVNQSDMQYLIKDGVVTLTCYYGNNSEVVVPSTVEVNGTTYSVTSIGDYAFYDCSSLESITIPNSVTSIGIDAFTACDSLASILVDKNNTVYDSRENCNAIIKSENNTLLVGCKNTIIPDSVTSIGNFAFYGCSSLESITIPDGVTSVGYGAFAACESLTSITIPNSVTSIGSAAFAACESLTSITIPNSVTSIDAFAFGNCSSLTTVTFEEGSQLTSIGYQVFYECSSLESITIPNSVTSVGYGAFANCSSLTTVTFEEGSQLTSIGDYAFYWCRSLQSITIPDSVTSVGECAFSNCSSLESITIPNSVTSIGDRAFHDCSSLGSIAVDINNKFYDSRGNCNAIIEKENNTLIVGCKNTIIPNSVESIADYAFYGCSSLKSITIPNSVTSIGDYAFYGCNSLIIYCEAESQPSGWNSYWNSSNRPVYWGINENNFIEINGVQYVILDGNAIVTRYVGNESEIVISSTVEVNGTTYSVTSIGDYAFYYCSSLESITIPNSVTSIGDYAFRGCSSLIIYCEATSKPSGWSSSWNSSRPVYWGITNEDIIVNQSDIQYLVKDGVVTLTCYYGNNSEVIVPSTVEVNGTTYSVTSIGDYAFYDCSSLESITIPDSVTSIGQDAFSGCGSLESITIPNSVTSIGSYAFSGCSSLESITIPNSVTSIDAFAFANCSSLIIYCEASSKPSGWNSYWNSNRPVYWGITNQDIIVNQSDMQYLIKDGVVTLTCYYGNNSEVIVPSTVEVNGTTYSVTSIGDRAFENCSSLTTVTFEEGSQLTTIGSHTFYWRSSLESITIPNSVTSIGDYAFYYCSSLESITIPNSVTSIGDYAFYGCNSLIIYCEAESQPSGWNSYWNSSIRPVYWGITNEDIIVNQSDIQYLIKEGVVTLTCYYGNNSEVIVPSTVEVNGTTYSVTSIGDYAFSGCRSLESITIPNSVTSIGSGAFAACESLTSITIPNSVTSIDAFAFANCSSLRNVYYIGTIEDWCNITFSSSNSNPMSYASHFCMLDENNEWYEVITIEIPSTITNIGNYQFFGFNNVTEIIIPNSVTSIGSYAFSGCSSLESITIPDSVTSIGQDAFSGCGSLESITIPNSVTSIGSYAFSGCSSLESITIPNSVTSIGDYAFSGCSSLESIIIPNSVTSIGYGAFYNCSSLESIIIPNSVTSIGDYAFRGCSSLIIYCEASSKPSGWSSSWNYSIRPVYWDWGITNEDIIVNQNEMQYLIKDGVVTLTYYYGNNSEVIVPSTVEVNGTTYSVASIETYAFYGCSSLTTVTFEEGSQLTTIGSYTFYGCSSLTSIIIPNSVTSIGYGAFYNCSSLTSIIIPNSVTSIGDDAFENCSSLIIYCEASSKPSGWNSYWNSNRPVYWGITNEDIIVNQSDIQYLVKDGVVTLTCYYGNNSEVIVPSTVEVNGTTYSVTSIGDYAFSNCSSLESITIPNSVTSIGNYAFYWCSSLESIIIPNSVTSIGDYAFSYCSSLTSITIPNSVTNIGDYAFLGCWSLESITTADSVTTIGDYAFSYCSSLTSITIPDSVESIGFYAFEDCSSLKSITIPNSVTSIDAFAFSNCSSLIIYCEASSKPSGWNSYWNSNRPVYWAGQWEYDTNGNPTPKI